MNTTTINLGFETFPNFKQ